MMPARVTAAATCGRLLHLALLIVALAGAATETAAQLGPAGSREVSGRVITHTGRGVAEPVSGLWVTLHRVAPGSAGPLDSIRTRADGTYGFRYRAAAGDSAVYFVSSSYGGIAYFSAPLGEAIVAGGAAELLVFDTTSVAAPISVGSRHIVISEPDSIGERQVLEAYELTNDGSLTRVAGGDGEPVWQTRIPSNAENAEAGQGDISPDAVTIDDGNVSVFAPLAPGIRQLSVSYTLPADAFPLAVPITEPVALLEIMLEDQGATAEGAGLTEIEGAVVEGRPFRRYVSERPPDNAVATIRAPAPAERSGGLYLPGLLLAIGVVMLAALASSFTRLTRRRAVSATGALLESAEELAEQIVKLDATYRRLRSPSEDAQAAYAGRRDELKARLTDALARRDNAS